MNIFYLHKDPSRAPQYLYDKHCVKMILETAQMLCTAHHHYGQGDNVPYKKAYYNHPSTQWARQSKQNYQWLYDYFVSINIEYHARYNKVHKSWIDCRYALEKAPQGIPNTGFTQPPQCMPDKYKDKCSLQAYWNYYIHGKSHIPRSTEVPWQVPPIEMRQEKLLKICTVC